MLDSFMVLEQHLDGLLRLGMLVDDEAVMIEDGVVRLVIAVLLTDCDSWGWGETEPKLEHSAAY